MNDSFILATHIVRYEPANNKQITQFNEQIKNCFCAAAVGEKKSGEVQASKLFYDNMQLDMGWKTNKQKSKICTKHTNSVKMKEK